MLGRSYPRCVNHQPVSFPKSTDIYKCDSSIWLTAVYPELEYQYTANCENDKLRISPNVKFKNPCMVGESYELKYLWYSINKKDTSLISTDESLLTDGSNQNYSLNVIIKTYLGNDSFLCTKTINKEINEADYISFAGKDFKQKGLIARFNPSVSSPGNWRQISGNGQTVFQNTKDPKTRVRVSDYGLYCFEWTSQNALCKKSDTVCIQFYKIQVVDPDTPNKTIDDRATINSYKAEHTTEFYTPTFINTAGKSYILFHCVNDDQLRYSWLDLNGSHLIDEQLNCEDNQFRLEIKSPIKSGLFFLVLDCEGFLFVNKVIVVE